MKFIHRLGYYLGGFAIGLIILTFFLSGKNASCDYGPNARTVKNISSKTISYNPEVETILNSKNIDSITVKQLIQYGTVIFSKSDTKAEPCKLYHVENNYKKQTVVLKVENCDSIATVTSFKMY